MSDASPKLDEDVVALLACPVCRSAVRQTSDALVCTSDSCRRQYGYKDGIPVLLPEEALVLEHEIWSQKVAE